jgi:hypothetical protein
LPVVADLFNGLLAKVRIISPGWLPPIAAGGARSATDCLGKTTTARDFARLRVTRGSGGSRRQNAM